MKTKFKDVAHFYPNAQIEVTSIEDNQKHIDAIEGFVIGESINLKQWGDYYFENDDLATIKPILKPMSEITEDDFRDFCMTQNDISISMNLESFTVGPKLEHQAQWIAFLCSKSFNVFNLDESEIATI